MVKADVIELLMNYGIRPSEQRIAIMQYLLNNRNHPSVDMIYEELRCDMPTLSKTTVYNVLHGFVEKGAVMMLTIDEKNVRYDACVSDHSHFKCSRCGRLFDMPQPEIDVFDAPGFLLQDVKVYYGGVCPHCNSEN